MENSMNMTILLCVFQFSGVLGFWGYIGHKYCCGSMQPLHRTIEPIPKICSSSKESASSAPWCFRSVAIFSCRRIGTCYHLGSAQGSRSSFLGSLWLEYSWISGPWFRSSNCPSGRRWFLLAGRLSVPAPSSWGWLRSYWDQYSPFNRYQWPRWRRTRWWIARLRWRPCKYLVSRSPQNPKIPNKSSQKKA